MLYIYLMIKPEGQSLIYWTKVSIDTFVWMAVNAGRINTLEDQPMGHVMDGTVWNFVKNSHVYDSNRRHGD